jgi:hypothetical protein
MKIGLQLLNKVYCKTTVIKTVKSWYKYKQIDLNQGSRDKPTYMWSLSKVLFMTVEKRESIKAHFQYKWGFYSSMHCILKNQCQPTVDLRIKHKVKLLKDDITKYIYYLAISKDF